MPCPHLPFQKRGFTLIELLISISIVAVLSGVTLMIINPSTIRAKTRDSRRASSLSSIQAALELYFAQNREYPATLGWIALTEVDAVSMALENGYTRKVELDPLQDASPLANPCTQGNPIDRRYNYRSDGAYYLLTAHMEVQTTAETSLCSNLSQWGNAGATCQTPTDLCYGVENGSR